MTQNTSHAVMAQRAEPHDSLDDFPTPPFATRAFCEHMGFYGSQSVWEPAANRGYMVKALREYFSAVYASDAHDYGAGFPTHDFLMPGSIPFGRPSWIITNPPFRLAQEFVERSLEVASVGVAVLVRSVWAEGIGRYEGLFRDRPPHLILQYVERVPMTKGRYDPNASTATSYSWFVWAAEHLGYPDKTTFDWIPPAKARLYRKGDELL